MMPQGNVDVGITYNNFRYLIAATATTAVEGVALYRSMEFAIVNKQISC